MDFGAELHLLHAVVWGGSGPAGDDATVEELLAVAAERGRTELQRLAAEVPPSAPAPRTLQRTGYSPAVVILEVAAEIGADLVVLGTHGRRGATRLFLGSVAEEVVRHAACPVLTSREVAEPKRPASPRRVLVPLDFSTPSRRVLSAAADLGIQWGATLQLLHVLELPPLPAFYRLRPDAPTIERLRQEAADEVSALAGTTLAGSGIHWEGAVALGRPAEEIVRFATENGADWIVLPTQGRGGLDRLLLGSTAERVLRMASCPVLTLTPAAVAAAGGAAGSAPQESVRK